MQSSVPANHYRRLSYPICCDATPDVTRHAGARLSRLAYETSLYTFTGAVRYGTLRSILARATVPGIFFPNSCK